MHKPYVYICWVLENACTCVTQAPIKVRTLSFQKVPSHPFPVNSLLWGSTIVLSKLYHRFVSPAVELCINKITQNVVLCEASFPQHVSEIHPCSCVYPQSTCYDWGVVPDGTNVPSYTAFIFLPWGTPHGVRFGGTRVDKAVFVVVLKPHHAQGAGVLGSNATLAS